MPQLILHIGLHKTGTTSIQRALGSYCDPASPQPVHYPLNLPPQSRFLGQHSDLAKAIVGDRLHLLESFFEDALQDALHKGAPTVVLSGERFSTLLPEEIETFRQTASKYFHPIAVVVVVRDLFEYGRSILQQVMKSGGVLITPASFAERFENRDPEKALTAWESVFPQGIVRRLFLEPDMDSVALFFTEIGLCDEIPERPIRLNTRVDFATAAFLNLLSSELGVREYLLQTHYEQVFHRKRYEFPSERMFWDEALSHLSDGLRNRVMACPSYQAWRESSEASGLDTIDYLEDLRSYIDRLLSELTDKPGQEQTAPSNGSANDGWLAHNMRRAVILGRWLATGQFSHAARAALSFCRRHVPPGLRALMPASLRRAITRRLDDGSTDAERS